jgi:hypothetical protein
MAEAPASKQNGAAWPMGDGAALIEADDVERILADIDAHRGNCRV